MTTKSKNPKKRFVLNQLNTALYSFSLNPSQANKKALTDLTGETHLSEIFERTLVLIENTNSLKSLEKLRETLALLDELYKQNPHHLLNEKVQKKAHVSLITQIKEGIDVRLKQLINKAPSRSSKKELELSMFKLCCIQFYRKMIKQSEEAEMFTPYFIELAQNKKFIKETRKLDNCTKNSQDELALINQLFALQDKYLPTEPDTNHLTMFMLTVIATAQSSNLLECIQSAAIESTHNEAYADAKSIINAGLNALQIILETGSPKILKSL